MICWLRNTIAGCNSILNAKAARPSAQRTLSSGRRTMLHCEALEDRLAPTVTVGPNINVSKTAVSEQENAVIINPTNPLNLFATSTAGAVVGGLGYAFSTDGGTTWQNSDVSSLPASAGDQQMAWDQFGNLFMTQLVTSGGNVSTIVALSTNGGASFSLLLNTNSFGDQPSIAVGPNSVWVDFNVSGPMEARGAAITGLGAIGAFTSSQQPGGLTGTFGDIAVGPNGQVMMVYQEQNGSSGPAANAPSELYFCLDPDGVGAQGFSNSVVILTTNVGSFDAIPAQPNRTIGAEANLAWDRTTGVHKGRVYLVYTDENVDESNDTEIFVIFSDNDGATWSTPVRVNDDPLGNGKSQFNPAIAVDQTTGDIAVTWYDCRNSPSNVQSQVFGSISRDGGVTWEANVQIAVGLTDATVSAAQGFDFGDYDKMDFHAGVFYRAWADNSNSTGDNPAGANDDLDLYIAKVTVPPGTTGGGFVPPGANSPFKLYNPVRFVGQRSTKIYRGLLTMINYTSTAVGGPIYIVFKKLPKGVIVLNATGYTKDGKPFIRVNRNLNPKKAVTTNLRLINPNRSHLESFFRTRHLTFTITDPT